MLAVITAEAEWGPTDGAWRSGLSQLTEAQADRMFKSAQVQQVGLC